MLLLEVSIQCLFEQLEDASRDVKCHGGGSRVIDSKIGYLHGR